MAVRTEAIPTQSTGLRAWLTRAWAPYRLVPLLGWIVSFLAAVLLEQFVGTQLVRMVGMSKVPSLLGIEIALKTPALIPGALLFVVADLSHSHWRRVAAGHPSGQSRRRLAVAAPHHPSRHWSTWP